MPVQALRALVAMLLLLTCAPGVWAQVNIISSNRVASLATAAGSSNAGSGAPGLWQPTLAVPGDASSAAIDSDVAPSGISLALTWSSTSNPGGALPSAVVQMQVQFSVASATQINFSRSNSGPASASLSVNDSMGATIVSPGQPDGSTPIGAGSYTLTYVVNCPVFASGANSFAVTFGAPPAPIGGPNAFTYQGRLAQSGAALPAAIDLQYAFFNAPSGATGVSGLTGGSVNNVPVDPTGLFTVTLDPGQPFPAGPAFLQLSVRSAGVGAFTTLLPRTPVTPAPKATFANTAALASTATTAQNALGLTANGRISLGGNVNNPLETPGLWLRAPGPSGADFAFYGMRDQNHSGIYGAFSGWTFLTNVNSGRVGIGQGYNDPLASPSFDLHLRGITDTQVALTGAPDGRTWSLQSSAGNYGAGSQFNGSFQIIDRTDNVARVLIDQLGNMGVGTTTPQSRLDVDGIVRANSLNYRTPFPSFKSIGDAAWRPRLSTTTVSFGLGNGGAILTTGDQFGAVAELELPHLATIMSITCVFSDFDSAQDLNFTLLITSLTDGSLDTVNLGTSSGTAGGTRSFVSTAPAGTLINNGNRAYQIRCTPSGLPFGQWTPNLAIRGVVVSYTMPGPAH